MANIYNFDDGDLQLSADKVTQFTAALATAEVADPLQQLCDEAADTVGRHIAGYAPTNVSIFSWIRALAVYNAYKNSGVPCPPDIDGSYKDVMKELTDIARGMRSNLPKVADPALASRSGSAGSNPRICGRMGQTGSGL